MFVADEDNPKENDAVWVEEHPAPPEKEAAPETLLPLPQTKELLDVTTLDELQAKDEAPEALLSTPPAIKELLPDAT
jgi:hypothetical protein